MGIKLRTMMFPRAIAVITGDLVGSTDQPVATTETAMGVIENASRGIAQWMSLQNARATKFTRFRGDGWQICLDEPKFSLRAALVIAASLRAKDIGMTTRLSIGIGGADTLGTRDLSDAAGQVFQLSGRELDSMPRLTRIALAGRSIGDRDRIIARQMFERTSRWTAPQAEAVALYLHPDNPPLHDIAANLGISPQAVNYRLTGGGAANLRLNLQLWEEVMEHDLANT
jgi:hypothetical protein